MTMAKMEITMLYFLVSIPLLRWVCIILPGPRIQRGDDGLHLDVAWALGERLVHSELKRKNLNKADKRVATRRDKIGS